MLLKSRDLFAHPPPSLCSLAREVHSSGGTPRISRHNCRRQANTDECHRRTTRVISLPRWVDPLRSSNADTVGSCGRRLTWHHWDGQESEPGEGPWKFVNASTRQQPEGGELLQGRHEASLAELLKRRKHKRPATSALDSQ